MKRLGLNAYLVDHPKDVPTFLIFNVTELYEYHGELPIVNVVETLPFADTTRGANDRIENMVDVKEIGTRHGLIKLYLVRWTRQPLSDCT